VRVRAAVTAALSYQLSALSRGLFLAGAAAEDELTAES
jgi:hypothetical protein